MNIPGPSHRGPHPHILIRYHMFEWSQELLFLGEELTSEMRWCHKLDFTEDVAYIQACDIPTAKITMLRMECDSPRAHMLGEWPTPMPPQTSSLQLYHVAPIAFASFSGTWRPIWEPWWCCWCCGLATLTARGVGESKLKAELSSGLCLKLSFSLSHYAKGSAILSSRTSLQGWDIYEKLLFFLKE